MTAVRAYNANPTAAIATYGPITDWCVSAVTDMSYLFYNLKNFDADVSNWDTSGVTRMDYMFHVRSSPCPASNLQSSHHCTMDAVAPFCWPAPSLRIAYPPFYSRQYASAFNQPLSFDTSSVTNMDRMFEVRSSPCPSPNLQSSPRALSCTLRAPRSPAASRLPARTSFRTVCPLSTLGSRGRRSTSR